MIRQPFFTSPDSPVYMTFACRICRYLVESILPAICAARLVSCAAACHKTPKKNSSTLVLNSWQSALPSRCAVYAESFHGLPHVVLASTLLIIFNFSLTFQTVEVLSQKLSDIFLYPSPLCRNQLASF